MQPFHVEAQELYRKSYITEEKKRAPVGRGANVYGKFY